MRKQCHKSAILIFLMMLLPAPAGLAADVSLAWDASVSPNIAGYKVYFGNASRNYGMPITIANQTIYTVTGLTPGTWYFSVTAFDVQGNESDFSNEVSQEITANQPLATVTLGIVPAAPAGPVFTHISASQILRTEATIVWGTAPECDGTLLWGTDPSRLLAIRANNLATTDHLALITGLTPRTHYFFKVESICGTQKITSQIHSFNTK